MFPLRILFGRLRTKSGSRFQGKSNAASRSSIILRFLAGCHGDELGMFIDLLLEPMCQHSQGERTPSTCHRWYCSRDDTYPTCPQRVHRVLCVRRGPSDSRDGRGRRPATGPPAQPAEHHQRGHGQAGPPHPHPPAQSPAGPPVHHGLRVHRAGRQRPGTVSPVGRWRSRLLLTPSLVFCSCVPAASPP